MEINALNYSSKTRITIFLKDKSVRKITVLGNWNHNSATQLAHDLDGRENISKVELEKA